MTENWQKYRVSVKLVSVWRGLPALLPHRPFKQKPKQHRPSAFVRTKRKHHFWSPKTPSSAPANTCPTGREFTSEKVRQPFLVEEMTSLIFIGISTYMCCLCFYVLRTFKGSYRGTHQKNEKGTYYTVSPWYTVQKARVFFDLWCQRWVSSVFTRRRSVGALTALTAAPWTITEATGEQRTSVELYRTVSELGNGCTVVVVFPDRAGRRNGAAIYYG